MYITDDGRHKVKEIAVLLGDVHNKIVEGIPEEKINLFIDLIKLMNENLSKQMTKE